MPPGWLTIRTDKIKYTIKTVTKQSKTHIHIYKTQSRKLEYKAGCTITEGMLCNSQRTVNTASESQQSTELYVYMQMHAGELWQSFPQDKQEGQGSEEAAVYIFSALKNHSSRSFSASQVLSTHPGASC